MTDYVVLSVWREHFLILPSGTAFSKAKRRFVSREIVGVLLWGATVIVLYGTLALPFVLHVVLVLAWLMGSGLAFVMVGRDNQREAQAIFEDSLRQINIEHSDILLQMATYSEARDAFTGEHLQSVRRIAYQLAVGLGESEKMAIVHDLGKIGIPDAVLGKPSELTRAEFNLIKTHTIIGEQVLGDSPLFELERKSARHHHEWWNGEGYPDGISGEEIPLVGRITAVADVFDALISKRPYKDPWPLDRAVDYLRERSGTQFDPDGRRGIPKTVPQGQHTAPAERERHQRARDPRPGIGRRDPGIGGRGACILAEVARAPLRFSSYAGTSYQLV